jgi:hypothetical protein
MRIELSDLCTYARCPSYYYFQRDLALPGERQTDICATVIKKAYLASLDTGHKVDWRRIIGWVDKLVFRGVSDLTKDVFEQNHIFSEHCLNFIEIWYRENYLQENTETFVDLSAQHTFRHHTIGTTLPIVKLQQPVTLTRVVDTEVLVQHDLESQAMASLLYLQTNISPIRLQVLRVQPRGGLSRATIDLDKDMLSHVGHDILVPLAEMMASGVKYPVVSTACETCLYRRRCRL